MKKSSAILSLLVILTIMVISSSSCKKKTEAVPDFPQLIGHWSGTTSVDTQILFWVNNISGTLNITQYDLTVPTIDGYQRYMSSNTYGIASINSRQFKIHLGTGTAGEAFINGTFNTNDMTVYGSYAVYPTGNTTDIITGTYSGAMGTK